MSTGLDWKRLGRYVERRRTEQGLRQQDVTARGGPSTATLRKIERGDPGDYHQTTLRSLDQALEWQPGSCHRVAAGGEPRLIQDQNQGEEYASEADELVARVVRSRFDRQTKTALIAVIRAAEAEQEQRHANTA